MLSALASLIFAASTATPAPTTWAGGRAGALTLELGALSPPLTGELPLSVRAWALGHGARYGLPAHSGLRSSDAFATRFGASFHLRQVVHEVEVHGAELVVTLDARARVVQVASSVATQARVVEGWALSLDQALTRAATAVPLALLRADGVPLGGGQRLFFPVGDELRAGWLVAVKTADLSKNWYAAVDAQTGALIFVQNRVYAGALDANVYPISPGGLDGGVGVTPTVTRNLTFLDGGSMVGEVCATPQADGALALGPNDGGELCGGQLMSYNCCPTAGCVEGAPPRRYSGAVAFRGLQVPVDMVLCERQRRASNLTSGTYEYPPVDPPMNKAVVVAGDLANSDPFAEVHAFYHVNRIFEWVRGLSRAATPIFASPAILPFTMRDERRTPPQQPAVWANVMFPNFNELLSNLGCLVAPPCQINTLVRLDNAAFFPRENFAQLPIPGFDTGVDTLLIFQGNSADAAYDATVIHHEFGHGVVSATAGLAFNTFAQDARSANNESGALHEAFADYLAGAFNHEAAIGPYFGPRALAAANTAGVTQETFLRSMDNTLRCPEVLWGEVHQDSQHVSAALWKARETAFAGTDHGDTFDAAFYAMLVSLSPNADFEMVAQVMAAKVATAFPALPGAAAAMTQIFADKGVIGCAKVIEVPSPTTRRPVYGIPSAPAELAGAQVPGPVQFLINAPLGARTVKISADVQAGPLGAASPKVTALLKAASPITFTRAATTLTNDATTSALLAEGFGVIPFAAACGSSVYVSLAAVGGGATLTNVRLLIDPAASCPPPTVTVPAVGTVEEPVAQPCGCSSSAASALAGVLALLGRRRRRHEPARR